VRAFSQDHAADQAVLAVLLLSTSYARDQLLYFTLLMISRTAVLPAFPIRVLCPRTRRISIRNPNDRPLRMIIRPWKRPG